MKTTLNKSMGRFISRNERHLIKLNGVVIDESPAFSLSQAVFQNFSGERHILNAKPHYSGGNMGASDWVSFQEKRLKITLSGLLELVNVATGNVITSCHLIKF